MDRYVCHKCGKDLEVPYVALPVKGKRTVYLCMKDAKALGLIVPNQVVGF